MFVKLMCLFVGILAADGESLSEKCPHIKNPLEPDLGKLSGIWHVAGFYPEAIGLNKLEFKGDAANYTLTSTVNETLSRTVKFVAGVDEENRKVLKPVATRGDAYADDGDLYLLAAEYDKFSILYSCIWSHKAIVTGMVLTRSKDMDEATKNKIKNVLQEYPQLQKFKEKFD